MALLDFLPIVGGALQSVWDSTVGQQQSKSLMRYQAQLNQQAIDQQNRYNSPIAQMERLREAGLNPNLVYGNGVEGNQSGAASVGIANRNAKSNFGLEEAAQNVFRRRQLENETNVSGATTEKLLADKLLSTARYLREMQEVAKNDATFDTYVKKAQADLDHTMQSIEESRQRVDESIQRISNMKSNANLLNEQIKYWKAHAENEKELMPDLMRARMWQAMQAGNLSEAQVKVAETVARMNDKRIEELEVIIRNLTIEGGSKAIDFRLQKLMDEAGLTGMKPKDFINYLAMLVKETLK